MNTRKKNAQSKKQICTRALARSPLLLGDKTNDELVILGGTTNMVTDKNVSVVDVAIRDFYHTYQQSKMKLQEGFN